MVERPRFPWRFSEGEGVRRRHKDVINDKVMASSAAHADHRPGVLNGGSGCRYDQMPQLRRAVGGQPRAISIHDGTRAQEPACVLYTTCEVPAPSDAIATIDHVCLAFRTQGASDTDVWGLAKEFSPDF